MRPDGVQGLGPNALYSVSSIAARWDVSNDFVRKLDEETLPRASWPGNDLRFRGVDVLRAEAILVDAIQIHRRPGDLYSQKHLLRIVPEKARLSYVTKPANLNRLVARMRTGGYADSWIRNSLWNGTSQLLQFQLGKTRTSAIISEADTPKSGDRRDIHLSPKQLRVSFRNASGSVQMFVIVVAGLGIDLAPELRTRVEDDFSRWTAYIDDKKTEKRQRTMPLPAAVCYAVKVLAAGKELSEKLFTLYASQ